MSKSTVKNLENLLNGSVGVNCEIVEKKTELLTPPGEHYGSVMLALDVIIRKSEKRQEKLNLVAKLIPANAMLRLAFNIEVTFKKEVNAYLKAIPALLQLQKEYNIPHNKILDIFPKCYGARISLNGNNDVVDEDAAIIFENLKVLGYDTEDRMIGFDINAAELIVKDLAKFHGVPIALRLLKPDVFEKKIRPCLVKNSGLEVLPEEVGSAFHNTIMETAEEIEELKPYLSRVKKVVDTAQANFFKDKPKPNELFATMSHSDYWVNNTMVLKDENGKVIKNKIVDLQIMTYNSAVRDLIFFLFTSVINSVLDQNIDRLIRLYYDSFIDVLSDYDLDLKPYSWEAFCKELEEVAPTEVYHILVMLKPICTERGKVNNLEDFQDSDWSRRDLLGPTHKNKLKDTVIALAKKNWI